MIGNTERHLERSLDLRTLLRLQSIVLALVRVTFDCDEKDQQGHLALLALQRNGNMMDLNQHTDATEHLIYGSDDQDDDDKLKEKESV